MRFFEVKHSYYLSSRTTVPAEVLSHGMDGRLGTPFRSYPHLGGLEILLEIFGRVFGQDFARQPSERLPIWL